MPSFSPRALSSAFALLAVALAACSDTFEPTVATRSPRIAEQLSSPTKRFVTISPLAFSSNSLIIERGIVTLTFSIENTGPSLSNVSAVCAITQKKTTHAACTPAVFFGGDPGVLPSGTSSVTVSLVASNDSAGQGTFVPGDAKVEVSVLSGSSTLATQSAPITLVSTAFVTSALVTDVNSGNPALSGSNTVAVVRPFGHPVSPYPRTAGIRR